MNHLQNGALYEDKFLPKKISNFKQRFIRILLSPRNLRPKITSATSFQNSPRSRWFRQKLRLSVRLQSLRNRSVLRFWICNRPSRTRSKIFWKYLTLPFLDIASVIIGIVQHPEHHIIFAHLSIMVMVLFYSRAEKWRAALNDTIYRNRGTM